MTKKMPAWSFSALGTFETCPMQYKSKYIDKTYVEPPQDHLIHGIRVHKAMEDRVKDGTPLPEDLADHERWVKAFEAFPAKQVLTEYQIGLTEGFEPAEFFGKNVWWRGVVDVALVNGDKAWVGDYKTGKIKPDFTQLNLFASAMFYHFPELQSIKQTYIWLKFGKHDSAVMHRSGVQAFWQQMLPRVQRLQYAVENDHWFEKPSGLCKNYCYHPTCQYRGKGR